MLGNNRGQIFTLIEILVVIAIIAAAGLFLARGYLGGGAGDTARAPKERAEAVDCMNNLRQIRSAIEMYQQANAEKPPTSLAALESSGVSSSMTKCSVSGTAYIYDPASGRVSCTTPGHERF
ncbi:MAG TPA: type II secretion system protein [Armatimonadota bacterium]|nr:type II secretion system protein [Armatimonadota bacterium]